VESEALHPAQILTWPCVLRQPMEEDSKLCYHSVELKDQYASGFAVKEVLLISCISTFQE